MSRARWIAAARDAWLYQVDGRLAGGIVRADDRAPFVWLAAVTRDGAFHEVAAYTHIGDAARDVVRLTGGRHA